MKKLILLIIGAFLASSFVFPAYAENLESNKNFYYTCFVKENLSEDAHQLNEFLANYFKTLETKNIKNIKNLYADKYISGDGFNRKKIIKILTESWDLSPDLEYTSEIQNIKFDSSFATVEINENLTGTTKELSEITKDQGIIESSSRILLYLQKYGKGWKIISDETLYEETSVKYGRAKGLDINIYAPDRVLADKNYSISLETEIPVDMFAVGSIVSEPLSFPRNKPEEIFRQVPLDIKVLERVVRANSKALNELAVASVSFCSVEKDEFKKPEISLTGTAIILKRINVSNIKVAKK